MPAPQLRIRPDPEDGRPAWNPRPGTILVPGALAWSRLGVGHHREAWLCWSPAMWEPVVVKIVRPVWSRPRHTRALRREAQALRALCRPGLPRLLTDGTRSPVPHLITDYFNGPPLDEVLATSGPLPASDVAHLAVDLLAAIRYLHAAGWSHLDICPDNVVAVEHRARLVDFGAARPLGVRLRKGEHVGTEDYLAPELDPADGSAVTPAADVYGVGATLREALDPGTDADGVVREVVEALTATDPDRRPTPGAALAAIVRATGGRGSRAWPRWADRHLRPMPQRFRPAPGSLPEVAG